MAETKRMTAEQVVAYLLEGDDYFQTSNQGPRLN